MSFHPRRKVVLPVVLALFLLGGGVVGGQAAEPAWSDDLFAELEGWSDTYNARADDVGFRGKSILSGERVNLHVRAADGSEAVYSFGTDADARVVDLRRGERGDATLRLATERAVIDRIVAAEDPVRALESALLSGRIGVKKVFDVLGMTLAVGPVEAAIGTVAVVAGAVAVTKVGAGGLSPKFLGLVERLKVLVGEIIVSLKLLFKGLEMVGIDLRENLREALWERLKARFRRKGGESVPDPTPDDDRSVDTEGSRETTPR
jgi:hypothetical protein